MVGPTGFGLRQGEIDDLTESAWPRTSILEALQVHGINRPPIPGRRLKYMGQKHCEGHP